MFRQARAVALMALTALGSLTVATAQESKVAGGKTKSPPKELAVDLGGNVKLKLVLIPAGEFKMGSGESAEATAAFFNKTYGGAVPADWLKNEHPQHRVRITKPFYLGTYHVTRGQFRRFVKDSGYKTGPGAWGWSPKQPVEKVNLLAILVRIFFGDVRAGVHLFELFSTGHKTEQFNFNTDYSWRNAGFEQTDDHPVVNVSWNDAVAFCKWLSKREGRTYRLPTEAEWEFACRAGTDTRYYNGADPEKLAGIGNVADAAAKVRFPDWKYTIKANDGYAFTAPVGKFKPNAFGLYDMHGNAWQWCADWYDEDYYGKSPADDPTGPDTGSVRVVRGGSWCFGPDHACSAFRDGDGPDCRMHGGGFRIARTN